MYEIPKPLKSALFFDTEAEARAALLTEGQKLEAIAKKKWMEYYGSYKPKAYKRTEKTIDGIKLGVVEREGAIGFQIVVTFEDEKMYHKSYVGKKHPRGHSFMLISNGWHAIKLEEKIGVRKRFTEYKGYNLLGKIMYAYRQARNKKVSLRVVWKGNSNYTR